MIYSLENQKIRITACTNGGELYSLTNKKDGTEYIWNGNPEYWKYHAPTLFPIIGKTMNSQYRVKGKMYELPAHGLARTSEFELIDIKENNIVFELKHSSDSLKIYPYKFSLKIAYAIEENCVKVTYIVENLDNEEIYFSIGGHPAFMCPIDETDLLENCYLEFSKKETASVRGVNKEVYLRREKGQFLNNDNIFNLSKDVFKNGLLMIEGLKSDRVAIKSHNSNKSITVDFNEFPYLCLWAPEDGAPFLCIEPWFGHPEYEDFIGEFKDRDGTVELKISEKFECSYKIYIE